METLISPQCAPWNKTSWFHFKYKKLPHKVLLNFMSNSGKRALRYKYIEEESGFAGRLELCHSDIPVPEQPQEPSKTTAVPRGAGSAGQQCHPSNLIYSADYFHCRNTSYRPGLNMQGAVQEKTRNIDPA